MLTGPEIASTQGALDAIAAERDSLRSQSSLGERVAGAFRDALGFGDPVSTVASAADAVGALYDSAKSLRDAAVESPDPAHEEALWIVQMANEVRGVGSKVEQDVDKASISTVVEDQARAAAQAAGQFAADAFDRAVSGAKWAIVGLVALAAIVLVVRFRR
jgi:hypothetical protein